MFYGYDPQGIRRVYGETADDCELAAVEYLHRRKDIRFIRIKPVSKTGNPLMQTVRTVRRLECNA